MTDQQKAPVLVAASAEGHIKTLPNNSNRPAEGALAHHRSYARPS